MPKWETKLKLGRKLDDVDNATASDNQISVLFRTALPEPGAPASDDGHVSIAIESDSMTVEDVAGLLAYLERRGVLTKLNSKVWISQPQASVERFGETTVWGGEDVAKLAERASSVTTATAGPPGVAAGAASDAGLARLREAERRLAEVEKALEGLRLSLQG